MSVSEILESIRLASTSERDKGDRFETLMRTALRTDRTYAEQFTDVWLWMDWPDRPSNEPDTGIDLVALNRDGGYTAIQCKNYSPTTSLAKEDIDSFFTASGRAPFTQRIIISTTDLWSSNAEKSLVGQQIPVRRIGVDDLDAMTIDWESVDINNLAQLPERKRHELRDHQRIAVEKVRAGFSESDRGKLIMACGTGKTFTGLRIAEDCGPGSTVLFLAPSIALVSQSLKEWTAESKTPIRPFAVCSDATAGKPLSSRRPSPQHLGVKTSLSACLTALPSPHSERFSSIHCLHCTSGQRGRWSFRCTSTPPPLNRVSFSVPRKSLTNSPSTSDKSFSTTGLRSAGPK